MQLGNKLIKRTIKVVGLLAVIAGIFVWMIDETRGAELPLLAGLFILLVSHEVKEDERSASLKASSTQLALIIGYAVSLLSANLYDHQVINVQLVAINHFLILVFALAIIIYNIRLYTA
ncbi:hypothetical protein ACFOET_08455 [Parapedobacter deserti]|uniref:DUF2178 domain-containing protein n=1 Tax=Parapedobacter deserti TaxID=1912957 RepID=A0ABV7JHR1_9SPHI